MKPEPPPGNGSLGPVTQTAARRQPLPWSTRAYAVLSAYLPILLMALLALSTWWLVKNTPEIDADKPAVAPRHEPDYTMHDFSVRRFAVDGRLRVQIEGVTLRHYPDTDTIEIDNVRLRDFAPDGSTTVATAQRAIANGDVTQVQLLGGAHVVREQQGAQPIDFRGEFLHAFLDTEQLKSHLPVVITQGGTELRGDSLDYDNLDRLLQLKGRVQAVFPSTSNKGAAVPATSSKP